MNFNDKQLFIINYLSNNYKKITKKRFCRKKLDKYKKRNKKSFKQVILFLLTFHTISNIK